MEVNIRVRNRDERDKVMRTIKSILESADYKDMDDYAWRYAMLSGAKVDIDTAVYPTELQSFEESCMCGRKTISECEAFCEKEITSNENGEDQENGPS